jgi:hypothetical protein
MNPIKLTICTDHLTIQKDNLPEEEYLAKLFSNAVPDDVRIVEATMHGKECVLFYGTPEALFKMIFNVTNHFDIEA